MISYPAYFSQSPDGHRGVAGKSRTADANLAPSGAGENPAPSPIRPMRVLDRGVYRGPHLYSFTPMVRIQVDLGDLEAWPSHLLPGFNETLLATLPGLIGHGCSYHQPGGFVRRLHDGTWMGHVAEHIAIELQSLAGSAVTRGKTRSVKGRPGVYNIMYAYEEESVGLMAGRLALQLLDSLLPAHFRGVANLERIFSGEDLPPGANSFDLEAAVGALKKLHQRVAYGPTTRSLVLEATRRGIPVLRLDEHSLVQLGTGRHAKRIRASVTSMTPQIATDAAGDKSLAKALLDAAGLPVPKGVVVRSARAAAEAAGRIGYPVVTKPLDGNHGRGVSVGLSNPEEVERGFEIAARHSSRVIVEQQLQGHDHRILVIDGAVVAVAERVPAHVVGDGSRNIADLIAEVNRDPRRGEGHEAFMTRIKIDAQVRALLEKQDLDAQSIPENGRTIVLRETANLSTGGTAVDRSDEIHPDNAAIARRAAGVIGLDVAGIDFLAPDISRSVHETGGGIVEVNAAPGFRMHLQPSEGRARNVARPVLEMLFPRGVPTRVPVIAVTGTNGKSTTARMIGRILQLNGRCVGLTSTTGIYIDEERILQLDASGPWSARLVLREPTVDVAVLETARGGILREGLAFSECDVGIVTNVQPDHLGLKGIETVDDLAWVKSVVVEAVHSKGVSVLNADDPVTVGMVRRAGGQLCYFSLRGGDAMPDFLRKHVEDGGRAVVREADLNGGSIIIHDDGDAIPLMRAADIPATIGGMADFNVQNAMAAAAACYAQGLTPAAIREGLKSFTTRFEDSPGRLNVYDGHGFRVILDYAHNPAGLKALGDLILKIRPRNARVIGMINIPGDRRDDDMREMGALATHYFDEIIFREDPARRGRRPGEIVALLTEGALAAGCEPHRIRRILDEEEAARVCLGAAAPGDLVVLTPTDVEVMWQQVLNYRPVAMPEVTESQASRSESLQWTK